MIYQVFADLFLLSLLLPAPSPSLAGGRGILLGQRRLSAASFEKCLRSRNDVTKQLVAAAWPVWMVLANKLMEPGLHLVLRSRWRQTEDMPRALWGPMLVTGVGNGPAPCGICSAAPVH